MSSIPNMRVSLIHPYLKQAGEKNRLKFRESLALGYLTAALEAKGFDVFTINAELQSLSPEEVCEVLFAENGIGLVGISAKSQRTYAAARRIAHLVKQRWPDVHITTGGVFPSAADLQVMDDCADIDSIVRGEGEYAVVDLANAVGCGDGLERIPGLTFRRDAIPIRTPNRPRIANLDMLPFPARRDLDYILRSGVEPLASAYLVASRGCYAACTFCSIHQIYGDHLVKRRSPESIVDEMETVIDRFGLSRFSFVDDLFITPSPAGIEWVHEFCRVIVERRLQVNFYAEMRSDTVDARLLHALKEAGLHRLFIGMEAGSDSVLKRWDKGTTVADNERAIATIREVGIPPHAVNFGYIMFDPEMSFEELKRQYDWVRDTGYCTVQHLQNKMNIYWGTPQYARMLAQGRVDTSSLGERWIYEFDDSKVGAIEGAFRRFHLRFQEECIEEYLEASERYRIAVRVHYDRLDAGTPSWPTDVLNQALRRCEQTLRDTYYFVLDALIELAERDQEIDLREEERIGREIEPLIAQLQRESLCLLAFADEVANLEEISDDRSPARGKAWQTEQGRVGWVWLAGGGGDRGYRAVVGASGADRYDHACDLVAFGNGECAAERLSTLREIRTAAGGPALVSAEAVT